ncbi:hypothetical protein ABPG74_010087 [Tetrahymena malaccensis]
MQINASAMAFYQIDNLESRKKQKSLQNEQKIPQGDDDSVTYSSLGDTNQELQDIKFQIQQINFQSRDLFDGQDQSQELKICFQDQPQVTNPAQETEQANPLKMLENKNFKSFQKNHRKSIFQEESLLKQITTMNQQSFEVSSSRYENLFEQQNVIESLDESKNEKIMAGQINNQQKNSNQKLQSSVQIQQVQNKSQQKLYKIDACESQIKGKSQRTLFANIFEKNQQQKKNISLAKKVELYVQKFITLLKKNRRNRKPENLTLEQRKLINDNSDQIKAFQSFSHSHCLLNFVNYYLFKFLNNSESQYIFMPTDNFKIIWDAFQIIFNFIFLFAYSIFLIFSETDKDIQYLNSTFKVFVLFSFLDILINCNSSYYLNDQVVIERKQIIINYMKSNFILDLISFSASMYQEINYKNTIVYNPDHQIYIYLINILIFLRFYGIYSKRRVFDNIPQLSSFQRYAIKLFNQIIFMVTIAHIMGIFWYLLGLYEHLQGIEVVWYTKYQQNLQQSVNSEVSRKARKNQFQSPLLGIKKNKECSKMLMQKISQQGGQAYEIVKMYSLEDYNYQSQQIIKNQSFSSESSQNSSDSQSQCDQKSKQSSDNQENQNKIMKKFIQENQNKLILQASNQSQISMLFQENMTQNSEQTKQTIRTFECPNSIVFCPGTEKKLNQEETQSNLPSCCETQSNMQQAQSHKEIQCDSSNNNCNSQVNALIFSEQKNESNVKPTKQAFIQKCNKDQTKQFGELESNKSVLFNNFNNNNKQKLKSNIATTSEMLKVSDSNSNENFDILIFNH